jgi:hypothetical protein
VIRCSNYRRLYKPRIQNINTLKKVLVSCDFFFIIKSAMISQTLNILTRLIRRYIIYINWFISTDKFANCSSVTLIIFIYLSLTKLKYTVFLYIYSGRCWHRNPVEVKISLPVQNRSGANPTYYRMGNGSLYRWIKWPERGVNYPLSSSCEIKEKLDLQLYCTCGPSLCLVG